ncbi:MAG TPA: response regulator, partial [Roseiflexaceae bacterium]|nr:response regulator [Roseiflexaceae bacterium]
RFRQADSTSQRSHNGLGLGLAIVRQLAELHGGSVEAASPGEGQGASFTLRLPITSVPATVERRPHAGPQAHMVRRYPAELNGLRVLVVDDQQAILELLEEILAPCGVLVRSSSNAESGLQLVQSWKPDVLLSDIAMPERDGYWLITRVRELAPERGGNTPAAALTAYVRIEERMRVLAAGFHQYVPKPIDPEELLEIVASLARNLEGFHSAG